MTTRWQVYDYILDETYVFRINPDSMQSPLPASTLGFGRNARSGGRYTTALQKVRPVDWQFGGVIRTQEFHDELNDLVGRRRALDLTDHLGRALWVYFTSFEVTERSPNPNTPWRLRYVMKAQLLQ